MLTVPPVTVSDRQILELESRYFRWPGSKDAAARAELGLSRTQLAQRLLAIVAAPAPELAVEFGPLINRLRRQLELQRSRRTARRAA